MESHKRSLAKSITWRIIALTNSFFVAYIFTGNAVTSGGIALSANIIAIILYYSHERMWNKINFGRK